MWREQRGGNRGSSISFVSLLSSSKSKKNWSQEEDDRLRNLIEQHGGGNWSSIADALTERTGKQCRERWHNHLQHGIKKGEWTEEEDRIIISMQRTHGNQWAQITKYLPGRTDNAVKNRFHATVRAGKTYELYGEDTNVSSFVPDGTTTMTIKQQFDNDNNGNRDNIDDHKHQNNGRIDGSTISPPTLGVSSSPLSLSPLHLCMTESDDDWMDLAIEPCRLTGLYDFDLLVMGDNMDVGPPVVNNPHPVDIDDDCCFKRLKNQPQNAILIKRDDMDEGIDESFAEIIPVDDSGNSVNPSKPSGKRRFSLTKFCTW